MRRRRLFWPLLALMLILVPACSSLVEDDYDVRMAGVFSGPTTDADYNALGAKALEDIESDSVKIAYSESVEVPDAERVIEEYVSDGYDIVWTHGSQFYEATAAVAQRNPDVTFIGEFDGKPESQPKNVWVLDRNFHTVFYPLGTMAANLSETGQVGYLGGLSLPFSYAEVNAVEQGIKDSGKDVELRRVWTGDFNDTIRAQQLTSQLISDGSDVILTSLNLAVVGAFQAVKEEDPGDAWISVKYTNKSANGPDHYAASVVYDFTGPIEEIRKQIDDGKRSGYYQMNFGTGASIDLGDALPDDVRKATEEAINGVESGDIEVELDQTEGS
ncbi:BMP family protein [Nocardioidaceae bacterium SCSIO 66511]|nr:BMP family protein [Nocardioidaceae bacterium SCSIO 66511]